MATHGYARIPVDPTDEGSDLVMMEAWSDGYLDGLGLAMLASSPRIADLSAVCVLFAGHTFRMDPDGRGAVPWVEGSYVLDSMCDSMDGLSDETGFSVDDLCEMAEDAMDLAVGGDIAGAMASEFGKIPLSTKIDTGFGMNATVMGPEAVWAEAADWTGIDGEALPVMDDASAAAFFARLVADGEIVDIENHYVWSGGRFLAVVTHDDGIPGAGGAGAAAVPLVMAAMCLTSGSGPFGNAAVSYLANPTPRDADSMDALMDAMTAAGIGLDKLLPGDRDGDATALVEGWFLEKRVARSGSRDVRQPSP